MQNKKLILNIFIVVVFLFSVFFILKFSKNPEIIQSVNIAGQNIKVELALSRAMQMQGLSGREKLPEGTGMLFVFPKPERHYFWMKDMKFDLDIIWIDQDLNVIYIKENASPVYFPKTYGIEQDVKYVLEVPAGFAKKYNLKIGDKVELVK